MTILSRRSFLKLAGLSLALTAIPRRANVFAASRPAALLPEKWGELEAATMLGRITAAQAQLISRPHPDGERLGWLFRDDVVRVLRNVVGKGWFPHNHVWVETPDGFVYSSLVQPVRHQINPPPASDVPSTGLWAEVSVPHTEGRKAPTELGEVAYRLYYSMVWKVDGQSTDEAGRLWYRLFDENGGRMFAPASHLRIILASEFGPLSPDVEDKLIKVNLQRQWLSAFEGGVEIFYARLSSGVEFFGDDGQSQGSLTKPGSYPIWSKRASRHMTGGTPEKGYDLPGVPWVSYFASYGAAIHGTYWHNDFGTPKSAGCLNVRPEDAKWLFRWTMPAVPYTPGDITVQWPGGTRVIIEEG